MQEPDNRRFNAAACEYWRRQSAHPSGAEMIVAARALRQGRHVVVVVKASGKTVEAFHAARRLGPQELLMHEAPSRCAEVSIYRHASRMVWVLSKKEAAPPVPLVEMA